MTDNPHGCIFCRIGIEPTKLKRQWVHHLPKEGRNIICIDKEIKPMLDPYKRGGQLDPERKA